MQVLDQMTQVGSQPSDTIYKVSRKQLFAPSIPPRNDCSPSKRQCQSAFSACPNSNSLNPTSPSQLCPGENYEDKCATQVDSRSGKRHSLPGSSSYKASIKPSNPGGVDIRKEARSEKHDLGKRFKLSLSKIEPVRVVKRIKSCHDSKSISNLMVIQTLNKRVWPSRSSLSLLRPLYSDICDEHIAWVGSLNQEDPLQKIKRALSER
mmetsp:Transcript_4444/g.7575  ORF Transcript_4444/g.7575 Transcript_4444/m.7575 type:complete len:207 (+) Transcript_4444:368-988(+)|eukprot:CAMPEP_0168609604 /NCGR_PEP_ID=MMETSP0449_2-20121227/1302_1 /TAXON_ID=1082188 /ORGANISM="Strombidium rassoulzadegani, Strain ras09" /LENGTH=206 /DNA_ID=CAMNT_0008649773 /DNA_START=278 /DNA_END=898 /DNA_ORIENTATION=-